MLSQFAICKLQAKQLKFLQSKKKKQLTSTDDTIIVVETIGCMCGRTGTYFETCLKGDILLEMITFDCTIGASYLNICCKYIITKNKPQN